METKEMTAGRELTDEMIRKGEEFMESILKPGRELDALVGKKESWHKAPMLKPYKCRKCGGSEFRTWGVSQRRRVCVPCHRAHGRKHMEANRPYYRAKSLATGGTEKFRAYRKKWALRTRYGLSVADYQRMTAEQGGVCKICQTPPKAGRALVVDHSHKTGAVRGLLCDSCNVGLANFRDEPERLSAAIKYLAALKAVGA